MSFYNLIWIYGGIWCEINGFHNLLWNTFIGQKRSTKLQQSGLQKKQPKIKQETKLSMIQAWRLHVSGHRQKQPRRWASIQSWWVKSSSHKRRKVEDKSVDVMGCTPGRYRSSGFYSRVNWQENINVSNLARLGIGIPLRFPIYLKFSTEIRFNSISILSNPFRLQPNQPSQVYEIQSPTPFWESSSVLLPLVENSSIDVEGSNHQSKNRSSSHGGFFLLRFPIPFQDWRFRYC